MNAKVALTLTRRQFLLGGSSSLMFARIAYASSRIAPDCHVGDREVLLDAPQRRRLGLAHWPDGTMGALAGSEMIEIYAANSGVIAKTRHDRASGRFLVDYPQRPILDLKAKLAYAAGGPVEAESDGSILLMYHGERQGESARRFYGTLGLARSRDGGRTFRDEGEILRPGLDADAAPDTVEIGSGGFVARDGHIDTYFQDRMADGRRNALTMARREDAASRKYFEGGFAEPGLGGRSTELGGPRLRPSWLSVAAQDGSDLLAMAYTESHDQRRQLFLAWSADGITWSSPQPVEMDAREAMYPSLIGQGEDPTRLGLRFYVYYTVSDIGAWDRWQDAALVRREITLG